jgi:putative flippase GtrA
LKRQLFFFVAVGCCAAFTHMSVVVLLVEAFGWPAAVSNIAAFCVAFCVSFNGHARFTFPQPPEARAEACRRFIIIALTAFTLNQLTYTYALTLFGPELYLPILFVVLLCVAAFTFTMSRYWAFALRKQTAALRKQTA